MVWPRPLGPVLLNLSVRNRSPRNFGKWSVESACSFSEAVATPLQHSVSPNKCWRITTPPKDAKTINSHNNVNSWVDHGMHRGEVRAKFALCAKKFTITTLRAVSNDRFDGGTGAVVVVVAVAAAAVIPV